MDVAELETVYRRLLWGNKATPTANGWAMMDGNPSYEAAKKRFSIIAECLARGVLELQEREALELIHLVRERVNCRQFPWPRSKTDWRQTPHGAPWDASVEVAKILRKLAREVEGKI